MQTRVLSGQTVFAYFAGAMFDSILLSVFVSRGTRRRCLLCPRNAVRWARLNFEQTTQMVLPLLPFSLPCLCLFYFLTHIIVFKKFIPKRHSRLGVEFLAFTHVLFPGAHGVTQSVHSYPPLCCTLCVKQEFKLFILKPIHFRPVHDLVHDSA